MGGPDNRKRRGAGTGRRGLKPGQTNGGSFRRGTSGNPQGRPFGALDAAPRKPVVVTALLNVLFREQLRDPRTGKLSRSKWAKPEAGAGMGDFMRYWARALYEGAHGDPGAAAQLVGGVTKATESIGAYLDDKAMGAPRTTIFVSTNAAPNQEIPPDAGTRQLTRAEGPYEEVREEDAP